MLHVIPVINTPNSYHEYNIIYMAPFCYFFAATTPNNYHGYNITYTSCYFFAASPHMLLLVMICSTYIPWLTPVTVITVTIRPMYRPTTNNTIYYYYNNLAQSKSMALINKNTFLFAMSMLLVPKLKVFFTIFFYIQYSDTKFCLCYMLDHPKINGYEAILFWYCLRWR